MRGKRLAIICGIVLSVGLFLTGSAGATERCVLAELFTSTT